MSDSPHASDRAPVPSQEHLAFVAVMNALDVHMPPDGSALLTELRQIAATAGYPWQGNDVRAPVPSGSGEPEVIPLWWQLEERTRERDEARKQLEGVEAERDTLRTQVDQWRSWAQFVYLGGGHPTGTDREMQAAVCAAQDAQVASLTARLERLTEALRSARQFLDPDVPRGHSSDGWANTCALVEDTLAALPLQSSTRETKDDETTKIDTRVDESS